MFLYPFGTNCNPECLVCKHSPLRTSVLQLRLNRAQRGTGSMRPQLCTTSTLCSHADLLVCRQALQRRPLRKFRVVGRAATSSTYRQERKKPQDAAFKADQLSQLAREVFDTALQSGPKGFARSMQAANAFASIGR